MGPWPARTRPFHWHNHTDRDQSRLRLVALIQTSVSFRPVDAVANGQPIVHFVPRLVSSCAAQRMVYAAYILILFFITSKYAASGRLGQP